MVFTEMTAYCFTAMPSSPDPKNSAFGLFLDLYDSHVLISINSLILLLIMLWIQP